MRKQNHRPINKANKVRNKKTSVKPFSKSMIAYVALAMFGNRFSTAVGAMLKPAKPCLHCQKKTPPGFTFCSAEHKEIWEQDNPQKGRKFLRHHVKTGEVYDLRYV